MNKPQFSKPFDIEAAKQGAPYCCRNGEEAVVAKWDRRVLRYVLAGYCDTSDTPRTWTNNGCYSEVVDHEYDLVMLPLGMIDGKPVFAGDQIMDCSTLVHASATPGDHDFKYCEWPVSAPKWPETTMTDANLVSEYFGGGPVSHAQEYEAWRRVANASIIHACESGAVVTAEAADNIRKEAYADGQASAVTHEEAVRAERDMNIAQAAIDNMMYRIECYGVMGCYFHLENNPSNIDDIIATVK